MVPIIAASKVTERRIRIATRDSEITPFITRRAANVSESLSNSRNVYFLAPSATQTLSGHFWTACDNSEHKSVPTGSHFAEEAIVRPATLALATTSAMLRS